MRSSLAASLTGRKGAIGSFTLRTNDLRWFNWAHWAIVASPGRLRWFSIAIYPVLQDVEDGGSRISPSTSYRHAGDARVDGVDANMKNLCDFLRSINRFRQTIKRIVRRSRYLRFRCALPN